MILSKKEKVFYLKKSYNLFYRINDTTKLITIKVSFGRIVDIKYIKIYNYNVRKYIDCGVRRLGIKGKGDRVFSPKDGKAPTQKKV